MQLNLVPASRARIGDARMKWINDRATWEIGAPFCAPPKPRGASQRSLSLIRKSLTTPGEDIAVCCDGSIWLTGMAEALANHLRGLDEATTAWYGGLVPIRDLVKLHQKEAEILPERAGKEPQPTVPEIRQNRRGTRCGLRARRAFIHLMAEEIDLWTQSNVLTDFDRIGAIVAFTRIGFPEVDADVVRKTLEPTTREGRRQWRADAHERKPGPTGAELPGFVDAPES
jgi:hypothetical protein